MLVQVTTIFESTLRLIHEEKSLITQFFITDATVLESL